MTKNLHLFVTFFLLAGFFTLVNAQEIVKPTKVSKAIFHDRIESFKDLPTGRLEREEFVRNAKLKERIFPNIANIPVVKEDPVWQKSHGTNKSQTKAALLNFAGQNTGSMPSDCNGEIGPNHFFQGVNTTLAIYDKSGTLVSGPTDYNTLFSGATGATRNDGDPIILFDSEAGKWLAAEFSLGSTEYMLIAVSETDDPTGAWNRWSFEMNGMPDYMKFGVWQDGYYMATNSSGAGEDDIYVFERSVMLAGGTSPKMVQFDNPNRPNSGFHTLQPLDNDGIFAPNGTPGQFITINDNAWSVGTNDEIWIYECDVDWATPANSTFARTQQISVPAFDTNFGTSWDNIAQKGTTQKLDAIPQILMYKAQYRNFGTSQSIVCVHAVDVDNTDHAGLRWYELQNTGTGWSVRQEGTYAPDEHSRWLASIAMNAKHEIALGYSISSATEYPGIRYAGQSAGANASANGTLDIAETTVLTGTKSQTGANRWGDYSLLSVDPTDDHTFWFTTEYVGATTTKSSRIVAFQFSAPDDPVLSATAVSGSQINLTWTRNDNSDDVMVAFSTDGVFGTPVDGQAYTVASTITGGGTVLYVGANETFNHSSLNGATKYYYKAWSLLNATPDYSAGASANAKTLSGTPTNHVTNFATGTPGGNSIPLSWTDANSGVLPEAYIIKVSDVDFASITAPVDGTDEPNDTDISDGTGSYKVAQGTEAHDFTGLDALTTYYFKIYPYTNSGSYILYKTDATVPETQATTILSYCSSTYSNTTDDWISNVNLNTINNTTGQDGAGSYGDYTAISTDVQIAETYNLSVSFESTTYTEHVWAWIDWNRNGVFTDAGEAYDLGQGVSTTLSTTIEVPADAYIGEVRMRVTEEWNNNPSPCGSDEYGETEDYTLNVNIACTPPTTQASNFSLGEITTNSLVINWTSGTQDVLVVAKEGSAVSANPTNGTVYTANSAYGTNGTEVSDGYVVFSGVGETVTITDLLQGINYYFTIYTYNAGDNCYNKVSPAEGQGKTDGIAAGINKLSSEEFKVYPNPSSGNFTLVIPAEMQSADVQITDMLGNVVLYKNINSVKTEIDISDKSKGIYFIKVISAEYSYTEKIIIK